MNDKENRIALITGGTRGIGAACAGALAKVGMRVVIVDIVDEQLMRFHKDTGFDVYQMDVSDYNNVEAIIEQIQHDVGSIDVLVNNAGITRDGMIHKMDPVSQWQAVIDVNLTGAFNTCRAIIPGMRKRGYGRIINISSMNGQRGQFGQSNYAAAKAGLLGFTRSIAQETAGRGITANAVCPGFIMTEMTAAMRTEVLDAEMAKIPVGRMGQPMDIAETVAFLAGEKSSFITGTTVSVNGGQYMSG